MAAMIASDPEVNHLDMDEFINFSVTNESPARPIIMRMNQAAAAAAAAAAAGSINAKDLPSSPPFDADFALHDLGANTSNEWLNNMGLDSVLSVCSPSSRGSSLETPNLPQNGFVSIDPTRLKEAASAAASEMSKSPSWSLPDLQPSSYEAPSVMSAASTQTIEAAPSFVQNPEQSIEIEQLPPSQVSHVSRAPSEPVIAENPVETPAHPSSAVQQPSSRVASLTRRLDNTVIGKRKRQGSLPDIFIQVPQQQQPQPRGLQRSMSTGTPVIITQFDTSPASLETFFGMPSPVQGPQSAPPIGQHPMSFAFQPAPAQTSATPLLRPQQNGHQRAFSHSGLATIPEAPSSAPADVQWTPIPPPQVRYGNTDITTYSVPAPPATPSLPCPSPMDPNSMLPSPLLEPENMNGPPSAVPSLPGVSIAPAAAGAALRRPSSCPGTSPSNGMPGRINYTFQLQQQEAQRQYLQPHGQQLQVQQQQHPLLSPQLGPHMSAQAHFSPLPTYSPQLVEDQFAVQNGPLSAGGMPQGGPLSAGPIPNGAPIVSTVGIGRPVMGSQSAHARRSSDSELAFAMGYPSNISAMLRSTSVPQTILAPTPMYASGIPPPPPIGNHPGLVAYEQNGHVHSQLGLGLGHPHRESSPPRKRVASKRVGTCLKPGPKGKPKPKPEGEMTIQLSTQPYTGLGDDALHSIHDEIPTNLAPVSFEEFQASFDITPAGTIIPMLGIEAMTERLMYATPEAVVDACFRWCYQIDSEYNMAAEKQSKFFRCCFDECVGSNSRIFMRKSAVDSHVRTHIGFRPFRCEVDPDCDARFVRKHDRDRHVATTHRNEKSFLCTDCGQNFARSDALLRHRAKRDACKARTGQL